MNPFLKRLASDIPLMGSETLENIIGQNLTADLIQAAEHPWMAKMRKDCAPAAQMDDGIAIVPVQGTLAHNPDPFEMAFYGVEDSRQVRSMIEAATKDTDVKGVVLRVDSPGGMMLNGPEMADAVMACRKSGKPVVAHIGGMGASLAYMIASQANEVIANRSAIVGSIGVIASIPDYSAMLATMGIRFDVFKNEDAKYKGAGMVGTSLTDAQRKNIQARIESAYGVFKAAVQYARPRVKPEAMQGQTFRGEEAVSMGLIDSVGSESAAIALCRKLAGG